MYSIKNLSEAIKKNAEFALLTSGDCFSQRKQNNLHNLGQVSWNQFYIIWTSLHTKLQWDKIYKPGDVFIVNISISGNSLVCSLNILLKWNEMISGAFVVMQLYREIPQASCLFWLQFNWSFTNDFWY